MFIITKTAVMANTYRKLYLQIIFAVKNREALLEKPWRPELFKYIAGTINQRKHYSLAVNGTQDHIHIFLDYNGRELIEDLVREIKKASSDFIKDKELSSFKFEWQSGYGVFSHGYREKSIVIDYVKNQEEHHRKKSFREEYMAFLRSYEIDYKDEYLFDFLD
jgi:putative transposase